MAIVSEGTTHGATIAADDRSFRVGAGFELPFDGAHAPAALFELFFGMAIGFIDGFRSLA